jgi:hypothetical protein
MVRPTFEHVEEVARPARDVVLEHSLAKGPHPRGPFALRHRNGLEDGLLHAVDVVRVDEERPLQFVGCPGEFTENEHAVVVEAAGHVLLGHEVHAVAQGGDEHHVGGEIERHHLIPGKPMVLVADRHMRDRAVVTVDAADRELDVIAQRYVGLHPLAAGVGNLNERDILGAQRAIGE